MKKLNSEKKKGKTPRFKNGHPRYWKGKKTWISGKKLSDFSPEAQESYRRSFEKKKGIPNGVCADPDRESLRRKRISERMKEVGGGYRKGSGVGKKGWYQGYWCDSSWELAYVVFNLDHGIQFSRNWEKFPYIFEGKSRSWIPDFKLPDGTFVEIKGYHTLQSKSKLESFQQPLLLLSGEDMKPYLDYVLMNYGSDFVRLYGEVAESGLKHSA